MIETQNKHIQKGLYITLGLMSLGAIGYFVFKERKQAEQEITEDVEYTLIQENENKTEEEISTLKLAGKGALIQKDCISKETNIAPKKKQNKNQEQERLERQIIPETSKEVKEINDDFPLKLGSKGIRVKELQVYLLRHYGWVRVVHDVFDATTQKRVEKYLKASEISKELFERLEIGKS